MSRYILAAIAVLLATRAAAAYPQFQLAKDQTCAGCHISPAGGGLLSENGLSVAEQTSTFGGTPEAAHGKLVGPDWLLVGGDFRAGAGANDVRGLSPVGFPMQAEMVAAAHGKGFTLYSTLGVQMGTGNRPLTFLQLREHYLMWQQDAGAHEGLFVRAGRFMPVYGLRFAEHNDVTRRFGQTPLYGETYGAAIEYVKPGWEAHVTGFVKDPIQDPIELGNGVAAYAEARPTTAFSIGAEGRYAKSVDDTRTAGGLTAKYWFASLGVLLQLEGQLIHQKLMAGGDRNQLVSYLMCSYFVHDGWMLDVGVSQYDEDLRIKAVDVEALDINLHWFATSHWELLFTNRVQTIAFGSGGVTSGYSLLQFHYRL